MYSHQNKKDHFFTFLSACPQILFIFTYCPVAVITLRMFFCFQAPGCPSVALPRKQLPGMCSYTFLIWFWSHLHGSTLIERCADIPSAYWMSRNGPGLGVSLTTGTDTFHNSHLNFSYISPNSEQSLKVWLLDRCLKIVRFSPARSSVSARAPLSHEQWCFTHSSHSDFIRFLEQAKKSTQSEICWEEKGFVKPLLTVIYRCLQIVRVCAQVFPAGIWWKNVQILVLEKFTFRSFITERGLPSITTWLESIYEIVSSLGILFFE